MAPRLLVGRGDAGYQYRETLERDLERDLPYTSDTSSSSRATVDILAYEGV